MKNFRFIYGFLIIAILIIGMYTMTMVELAASLDPNSSTGRSGAQQPGGKNTLGELIELYDLDKEEFYEAIHLPLDFSEKKRIINLVRSGEISYSDINGYMKPIIEEHNTK